MKTLEPKFALDGSVNVANDKNGNLNGAKATSACRRGWTILLGLVVALGGSLAGSLLYMEVRFALCFVFAMMNVLRCHLEILFSMLAEVYEI
jgi:hypothetical protein